MEQASEEERPLVPGQECIATLDFDAPEKGDLPFRAGDHITIIEPCELLFWYIAKNSEGEKGMVPRNFLEPAPGEDENDETGNSQSPPPPSSPPPPALPYDPDYVDCWDKDKDGDSGEVDSYLHMNPTAARVPRGGQLQTSKPVKPPLVPRTDPVHSAVLLVEEKEKRRRYPTGTLVMGICPFNGEQDGDLPFSVYEELILLHPLEDLCWYQAQKTNSPEEKGSIPITHTRLVYMSDDEDEDATYKSPTKPGHDRLYDDINDFISQSGWFSYPGLAHGKLALRHVLAKKARLSFEVFMGIKEATYLLQYLQGEKVYVGKATLLHEELCKHFECFHKTSPEIREIDDELCHHTNSSGWEITIWPLLQDQQLEVEWAKKIIEHDALIPSEATQREEEEVGGGHGQNEAMTFNSIHDFDKFWEWFSPN